MPEVAVQDAVEVLLNNRHLDSTLTFRLTQWEEDDITAQAEAEGRTLSSMLRKLIKDGKAQKEHSPRSVDTIRSSLSRRHADSTLACRPYTRRESDKQYRLG